jgi:hypothetical protein
MLNQDCLPSLRRGGCDGKPVESVLFDSVGGHYVLVRRKRNFSEHAAPELGGS